MNGQSESPTVLVCLKKIDYCLIGMTHCVVEILSVICYSLHIWGFFSSLKLKVNFSKVF